MKVHFSCVVLLFCTCDDLNTSSKKWYQAATQYTKGLGTRKNLNRKGILERVI